MRNSILHSWYNALAGGGCVIGNNLVSTWQCEKHGERTVSPRSWV